ncbi:MAG TPA: urease subunit gamma [Planctomycetota bacterium]|nr:urease subunit gamma [Planctomycetota bacterium]
MHLSPEEIDKLMLHNAGFLAQKRLARGLRLNHPEAVALIAVQILEFIRDGRSVAETMEIGRQLLGYNDVMDGVPAMVEEVRVEGTFPDGMRTVVLRNPIREENGNLMLALYGSFLPVPAREAFEGAEFGVQPCALEGGVGEIVHGHGDIELNARRHSIELNVGNRSDRAVQVSSHFHFMEANRVLTFDRGKAYGMRLDIPAGTMMRFEAGETKSVRLVEISGNKLIRGGTGLASGPLNDAHKQSALSALGGLKFGNVVKE